jgi:hypothetical protein
MLPHDPLPGAYALDQTAENETLGPIGNRISAEPDTVSVFSNLCLSA